MPYAGRWAGLLSGFPDCCSGQMALKHRFIKKTEKSHRQSVLLPGTSLLSVIFHFLSQFFECGIFSPAQCCAGNPHFFCHFTFRFLMGYHLAITELLLRKLVQFFIQCGKPERSGLNEPFFQQLGQEDVSRHKGADGESNLL